MSISPHRPNAIFFWATNLEVEKAKQAFLRGGYEPAKDIRLAAKVHKERRDQLAEMSSNEECTEEMLLMFCAILGLAIVDHDSEGTPLNELLTNDGEIAEVVNAMGGGYLPWDGRILRAAIVARFVMDPDAATMDAELRASWLEG